MAEVAPEGGEFTPAQGELGAEHLAGIRRDHVHHPAERVRPIERRARASRHLDPVEVPERHREPVPLLGAEERDRQVPPIQQHQNAAIQRRIEPTGVDVIVVDPALDHVHAWEALECNAGLAGERRCLEDSGSDDGDGGGSLNHSLRRAGGGLDRELAQRNGRPQHRGVDRHGLVGRGCHLLVHRPIPQPAELDHLRSDRHPLEGEPAGGVGGGPEVGAAHQDGDSKQRDPVLGPRDGAGDAAGGLGSGRRGESQAGGAEAEEYQGRVSAQPAVPTRATHGGSSRFGGASQHYALFLPT